MGGHFPSYNINILFQIKHTETILSNTTRKLLWFEITKMLTAVSTNKFTGLCDTIFGTLSFPAANQHCTADYNHTANPRQKSIDHNWAQHR